MTIAKDSRLFKCEECNKIKRVATLNRYIPCDNKECDKIGMEMKWIEEE